MRVTIQLHRRDESASPAEPESLADLRALVSQFGGALEQLHPGATHPLLSPFFVVDLADRATADALVGRLRNHPAIEAAYIAPAVELP